MRARKVLTTLVVLALVGALAGCAKKSETTTAAENSTTTTAESSSERTTATTGSSSSGSGSSDTMPNLENLGDCMAVAGTYASLFLGLLMPNASDSDKAKVQQELNDLKAKVPADIQKDLQTISDGLQNANSLSELSDFMDSAKFKAADANIQKYLDEQCGNN